MAKTFVDFDPSGSIKKIKFDRDRPSIPDTVRWHLAKDYDKRAMDPAPENVDLRHMIAAEFIFKYWQKSLRGMKLSDAEDLVKEKIDALRTDASEIKYTPQKKYKEHNPFETGDFEESIEARQNRFKENLDTLIYLEMTSHKNLFYGDASHNQLTGGEVGRIRKSQDKTYRAGLEHEYTVQELYQAGLDLGTDDNPGFWGMSVEKRNDATKRYTEIFAISLGIIQDNPKRVKYDRTGEWPTESLPSYLKHQDDTDDYQTVLNYFRNPNKQNKYGDTFLHTALKNGDHDAILELLKKEGININLANYEGDTPLHIAARSGNKDLVQLLLDNGAQPYVFNLDGKTPHNLAGGNTEMERLLDPQQIYGVKKTLNLYLSESEDESSDDSLSLHLPGDPMMLDEEDAKKDKQDEKESKEESAPKLTNTDEDKLSERPKKRQRIEAEEDQTPSPTVVQQKYHQGLGQRQQPSSSGQHSQHFTGASGRRDGWGAMQPSSPAPQPSSSPPQPSNPTARRTVKRPTQQSEQSSLEQPPQDPPSKRYGY